MSLKRLQEALCPTDGRPGSLHRAIALALSVAFSVFYGIDTTRDVLGQEFVIQDDAAQHVVWMFRFVDPGLFPGDLIPDYYRSVAPQGYALFYRLWAAAGVDPLMLSKFLPIGLGAITTVLAYRVCMMLLPVPSAAFLASLLLSQSLWSHDDLTSATPRAFAPLLILLFFTGVLRRSSWLVCFAVLLAGLVFPPALLVIAGVLIVRLATWQGGRIRLIEDKAARRAAFVGLTIAIPILVGYAVQTSSYGPVITDAEARSMPEFQEGGRSEFFVADRFQFWLRSGRSGLFPEEWFDPARRYFLTMLLVGSLLPLVLRLPRAFPLARAVSSDARLLAQFAVASVGLFLAAHMLLFRLYLPSRYVVHSARLLMALTAAITLVILFDAVLRKSLEPFRRRSRLTQVLTLSIAGGVFGLILAFPALTDIFSGQGYEYGRHPALYRYFSSQPQDILIASLSEEADNIPAFARRSVLAAEEYAIPYHTGYFAEIRRRTLQLIEAHYTTSLGELQAFVSRYGVDFLLIDRDAFTSRYVLERTWIAQYAALFPGLAARLDGGAAPALQLLVPTCSVFETTDFSVVDAACILNHAR